MKKIIFLFAFVLPVICMGQNSNIIDIKVDERMKMINRINPSLSLTCIKAPSVLDVIQGTLISCCKTEEYEATVFDPGFDSFLAMQQPKEFYSEANLKSKNTLMVVEWNYRYNQPLRYDPLIYEVKIDYESAIQYGLDVEYKLYMFFKFMEKQHKISLTI